MKYVALGLLSMMSLLQAMETEEEEVLTEGYAGCYGENQDACRNFASYNLSSYNECFPQEMFEQYYKETMPISAKKQALMNVSNSGEFGSQEYDYDVVLKKRSREEFNSNQVYKRRLTDNGYTQQNNRVINNVKLEPNSYDDDYLQRLLAMREEARMRYELRVLEKKLKELEQQEEQQRQQQEQQKRALADFFANVEFLKPEMAQELSLDVQCYIKYYKHVDKVKRLVAMREKLNHITIDSEDIADFTLQVLATSGLKRQLEAEIEEENNNAEYIATHIFHWSEDVMLNKCKQAQFFANNSIASEPIIFFPGDEKVATIS